MLNDVISDHIFIRATVVDADTRLHVRNCLDQDPKLKIWADSLKEEIESTLVEQADGM